MQQPETVPCDYCGEDKHFDDILHFSLLVHYYGLSADHDVILNHVHVCYRCAIKRGLTPIVVEYGNLPPLLQDRIESEDNPKEEEQ